MGRWSERITKPRWLFGKAVVTARVLMCCASVASAAEYYISPAGGKSHARDNVRSVRSFAQAAEILEPGDTLHVAAGRYREPISFESLRGTPQKPIRIVAEPGAVLVGTRPIVADFKRGENGIWTATIDFDLWQLFVADKLAYLARWPDASFEDGSIWRMNRCMRSADGGYDKRTKQFFGKCKEGLIYDAPFRSYKGKPGFHEGDSRYDVVDGQQSLADSGKDFAGAVAVLNIGHWRTWARRITKHGKGSDHFAYDVGNEGLAFQRFFAWYVLGLAALDRPNEWWFDNKTRTVHLMPPDGSDPNDLEIRGKVRDHGIVLKDCADLHIRGLRVFAQGLRLDGCRRVRFEDCRFDYPATHRFVLGDFAITTPSRTGGACTIAGNTNRDIALVNCEFGYSNAPLYLMGTGTLVENCYFHDIEWDVNSSGACGAIVLGRGSVFRRNTVARAGNSEGVRPTDPGCTIVLNHLYDMGNLQHDGAAINVGTRDHVGCLVERNWTHDCNRQGVRFDYSGEGVFREDGKIHGDGVYLRNVTWNTQPNQVKGDRHLVLNNTVLNCNRYPIAGDELMNMGVMGFKAMHGLDFNENSVTRNNLANLAHRSWNFRPGAQISAYELPGIADHNMRERGAALKYLRDPANYDFRPRRESPLVDGGRTVEPEEVKSPVARFNGIDFLGKAPDIGAYEHDARRYWIPGRREETASTPVPKDGGVDVPLDADLMFLGAYTCRRHRVFFGTSKDNLKLIADFNGDSTNIVAPPELKPKTTYFWRINALDATGNTKTSRVWSFSTSAAVTARARTRPGRRSVGR